MNTARNNGVRFCDVLDKFEHLVNEGIEEEQAAELTEDFYNIKKEEDDFNYADWMN
jgi:hypothetical protein